MPLMLGTNEMKIPFAKAYLGTKVVYEEGGEEGNGLFVAVGERVGVWYSKNGRTWIAGNGLPSTSTFSDVVFGNGLWVTIDNTKARSYISSDGITWTEGNRLSIDRSE